MKTRDDIEDVRRSLPGSRAPDGSRVVAVRVVDLGSRSEEAGRYFLGRPLVVGGPEVEGGPVSISEDGEAFAASPLGEQPPVGANALALAVPNRYAAFRQAGEKSAGSPYIYFVYFHETGLEHVCMFPIYTEFNLHTDAPIDGVSDFPMTANPADPLSPCVEFYARTPSFNVGGVPSWISLRTQAGAEGSILQFDSEGFEMFFGQGFNVLSLSCDPLTIEAEPLEDYRFGDPPKLQDAGVSKITITGIGGGTFLVSPGPIPASDLILSWDGPVGAGSARLHFDREAITWRSDCLKDRNPNGEVFSVEALPYGPPWATYLNTAIKRTSYAGPDCSGGGTAAVLQLWLGYYCYHLEYAVPYGSPLYVEGYRNFYLDLP